MEPTKKAKEYLVSLLVTSWQREQGLNLNRILCQVYRPFSWTTMRMSPLLNSRMLSKGEWQSRGLATMLLKQMRMSLHKVIFLTDMLSSATKAFSKDASFSASWTEEESNDDEQNRATGQSTLQVRYSVCSHLIMVAG